MSASQELVKLADGVFVVVDTNVIVSDSDDDSKDDEGLAGAGPRDVVDRLQAVAQSIVDVCATVRESVTAGLGGAAPKELTLEFGVKLGGKAGIPFVTEGSGEAAFKITAKW